MTNLNFLTTASLNSIEPKPRGSKRNVTAGHNFERSVRDMFRRAGYPHVVTTRGESKSRDNDKIDLMNKDEGTNGRLPYNIQCKNAAMIIDYEKLFNGCTKRTKVKSGKKMNQILNVLIRPMPVIKGIINVIIHKYTSKSDHGKFIAKGYFAILKLEDFMSMVEELERLRKTQNK